MNQEKSQELNKEEQDLSKDSDSVGIVKGNKKYLYRMLTAFGALALSILLFFIIFRIHEFNGAVAKIVQIFQPFIFGGVIAYLLRPICDWIDDKLTKLLPNKLKKLGNPIAVAVSLVVGVSAVSILIGLVIPQLYDTIMSLYKTLPDKVDGLIKYAEAYIKENQTLSNNISAIYSTLKESAVNWVKTSLLPKLQGVVSGVGSGAWNSVIALKNLLIGIVVSAYFLGGRKNFLRQGKLVVYSTCKKKWADIILNELSYADQMFTGFVNGKIFDSIIIGLICFIFCLVTKMPNGLLISVIVGVTNVIPFFGPIIGAIPCLIIILVDSPIKALWFLIFAIVIQTVDSNILTPAILGDKIGLSSFWVLFSILVFGGLFGIVGMIIGVPLFAVIYDIIRKLVNLGLVKHGYDRNELVAEITGIPGSDSTESTIDANTVNIENSDSENSDSESTDSEAATTEVATTDSVEDEE